MTQAKDYGMKAVFPFVSMIGLFILIYGLALLMVGPFTVADVVVFENPNDPANLFFFFASIFVFTLVILLIAKFWKKQLIRGIVLGAVGYFAFDFFYFLSAILVPEMWALVLSITAAAILVVALLRHPEWYVIDACCVIVGVGSVAIFGISLSVFLVIVLLIGLAIYDALSVYKTKHMIDLADTILDLRLPLALVIPKMRKYSLMAEEKRLKEKLDEGEERNALFIGLGDVVIPGFLVVSTFHNIANNGLYVSLSVMLGTLLGFIALLKVVVKGRPQAGLPYLCSGAILGYLVSSYLLFGELVGLAFPA